MAGMIRKSIRKVIQMTTLISVPMVLLFAVVTGAAPAPPEVKTMTYKTVGDRELKIYIHYPPGWKASEARPAIIFFFGGGWTGG
ncbi:MAG TPA: hypothetical protein VMW24_20060, partial [Sedimentisphaerales bacterium]|nr:hypothetical protein [Sedimentisphaerales bacterium]